MNKERMPLSSILSLKEKTNHSIGKTLNMSLGTDYIRLKFLLSRE